MLDDLTKKEKKLLEEGDPLIPEAWERIYKNAPEMKEASERYLAKLWDVAEKVVNGDLSHPLAPAALQLAELNTFQDLRKRFITEGGGAVESTYELAMGIRMVRDVTERGEGLFIMGGNGVGYYFNLDDVHEAWNCANQAQAFTGSVRVNGTLVERPKTRDEAFDNIALGEAFNKILECAGREDLMNDRIRKKKEKTDG